MAIKLFLFLIILPVLSSGQKDSSNVELMDGVAETTSLLKNKDKIYFSFTASIDGQITLSVTPLVGQITTFVKRQSDQTRFQCKNNYCEFTSITSQSFLVELSASPQSEQIFSIVYKQAKECYQFQLGTPIYIQLDPKDTQCIQYLIKSSQSFEISHSLTSLQLLNKQAQIIIEFQTGLSFVMTGNSYLFSEADLAKNCPKSSNVCKFVLKFASFQNEVQMEATVQYLGGVVTIYDGVVQKVNAVITQSKGRYFRYPLSSFQSLQIFLTSETYTSYEICAIVAEKQDSFEISKFPTPSHNSTQIWHLSTSPDSPSLTILPISKPFLKQTIQKKQLTSPWLLISIFPSITYTINQHSIFEIQVTQNERILREGDQRLGFLEPFQIISYQVYPSYQSLLSIRSVSANQCFKIYNENNKETENDIYIEHTRNIPLLYYIKGQSDQSCIYQITLQNFEDTIITVTEGFSTQVIAEYQETIFLLYYHNRNSTFKIIEQIISGTSRLYATPILSSATNFRQYAQSLRLPQYKYKADQLNNLEITSKLTGDNYCFNCYYLIAIKGNPSVHQEIVIAAEGTPINLRQGVVEGYLMAQKIESYSYYVGAEDKFNVYVDIVYGQINLDIITYRNRPQGDILSTQTMNKASTVTVAQPNPISNFPTNPLSQESKYKISITSKTETLYRIQINTIEAHYNIIQGIHTQLSLLPKAKISLQYDCLVITDDIVVNIEGNFYMQNDISIGVFYRQQGSNALSNSPVQFTKQSIGKLIMLQISPLKGHFTIEIKNLLSIEYKIKVLIPKPGLTELRPLSSILGKQDTIYEIYIEQGKYAIIQIYACQGNIKVRGSQTLDSLRRGTSNEAEIQLPRQNVGGHFVVITPNGVKGQYFIRVQNKQFEADINNKVTGISYMIKYSLVANQVKNLYNVIDPASSDIKLIHDQNKENIEIELNIPKSESQDLNISSVKFLFMIGKSPEDIKNSMFCLEDKSTHHLSYWVDSKDNLIAGEKFVFQVPKIEIATKGGDQDSFIGALGLVFVQTKVQNQIPAELTFIYTPAYFGTLNSQKIITAFGMFELMVVIAMAVGGLVVVYALAIHLINVIRGYSKTTELIEEESQQKSENHHDGQLPKSEQFQISHQQNN